MLFDFAVELAKEHCGGLAVFRQELEPAGKFRNLSLGRTWFRFDSARNPVAVWHQMELTAAQYLDDFGDATPKEVRDEFAALLELYIDRAG